MKMKKFLAALLIGSFLLSLPAFNFDITFTQNQCYAITRSEVRKKQERFEKARDHYEECKRAYAKAITRRNRNSSEVQEAREDLQDARDEYRKAKSAYERALRQYDNYKR